jgi:hypothetical protein
MTASTDFPTANALYGTNQGGTLDAFVAKLEWHPDFSFSPVSPITADVGGSGNSPVDVNSFDDFSSAVALTGTGQPAGVTPSFDPASVTPSAGSSASSTLTVNLGLSVVPGSFTLNVDGTSDSLTHSTPVQVTVQASASGTSTVVSGLEAAGCIDNSGISGALIDKLARAQAYIDAGNIQAAINTLNALLNQLQAQAGKHIGTTCTVGNDTFDPSAVLITQVEALLASLGSTGHQPNPVMGYVMNSKGVPLAGATVSVLDSSNAVVTAASTDMTGFYFIADSGILTVGSNYTAKVTPVPKPYKGSTPASQTLPWSGTEISLGNFMLK